MACFRVHVTVSCSSPPKRRWGKVETKGGCILKTFSISMHFFPGRALFFTLSTFSLFSIFSSLLFHMDLKKEIPVAKIERRKDCMHHLFYIIFNELWMWKQCTCDWFTCWILWAIISKPCRRWLCEGGVVVFLTLMCHWSCLIMANGHIFPAPLSCADDGE